MENGHLAEELRVSDEHRLREQMMNSRLKRIERYVHHPEPAPGPAEPSLGGSSPSEVSVGSDEVSIHSHSRTAGPAGFQHLAEQYRQQKILVHSNESKINVLRGQQQKQLDTLTKTHRDHYEALQKEHDAQLAAIDGDFSIQEKALAEIFEAKRALLELFWLKQAVYEHMKVEKATGQQFQALPPVLTTE
jgi:hypothetical protein